MKGRFACFVLAGIGAATVACDRGGTRIDLDSRVAPEGVPAETDGSPEPKPPADSYEPSGPSEVDWLSGDGGLTEKVESYGYYGEFDISLAKPGQDAWENQSIAATVMVLKGPPTSRTYSRTGGLFCLTGDQVTMIRKTAHVVS